MKTGGMRLLKVFFLVLFVGYMGNLSFFMHSHVINGVTIVHSHPFAQDSDHEHSTSELQLIHQLNTFTLPEIRIETIQLTVFQPLLYRLCPGRLQTKFSSFGYRTTRLRAPPVRSCVFSFLR